MPYLIALLRDAIVHAWLASVGVCEDGLTDEDRADITFAFGGVIAFSAAISQTTRKSWRPSRNARSGRLS